MLEANTVGEDVDPVTMPEIAAIGESGETGRVGFPGSTKTGDA